MVRVNHKHFTTSDDLCHLCAIRREDEDGDRSYRGSQPPLMPMCGGSGKDVYWEVFRTQYCNVLKV